MFQERNVVNTAVVTTLFEHAQLFFEKSGWMLCLGLILILVDLRFGVKAAKVRKEKVKISRAFRRTGNKIIDYFCWVMVAYFIGQTFGGPFHLDILPYIVIAIIYLVELESMIYNYFESRGKKVKIGIWKWFESKTGLSVETKDSKDDTNNNDNKNTDNKSEEKKSEDDN